MYKYLTYLLTLNILTTTVFAPVSLAEEKIFEFQLNYLSNYVADGILEIEGTSLQTLIGLQIPAFPIFFEIKGASGTDGFKDGYSEFEFSLGYALDYVDNEFRFGASYVLEYNEEENTINLGDLNLGAPGGVDINRETRDLTDMLNESLNALNVDDVEQHTEAFIDISSSKIRGFQILVDYRFNFNNGGKIYGLEFVYEYDFFKGPRLGFTSVSGAKAGFNYGYFDIPNLRGWYYIDYHTGLRFSVSDTFNIIAKAVYTNPRSRLATHDITREVTYLLGIQVRI